MSGFGQELCKPSRQLRVDHELHAVARGTTRRPAARAPNSNAAGKQTSDSSLCKRALTRRQTLKTANLQVF
jgi:hypothetical protein